MPMPTPRPTPLQAEETADSRVAGDVPPAANLRLPGRGDLQAAGRHARTACSSRGITLLLALAFCAATPSLALAIFIAAADMPVERLVRNTEAYIKEHPQDPHGHFMLARIHSYAYTLKTRQLPAFNVEDEKAATQIPALDLRQIKERKAGTEPPDPEALKTHLTQAVLQYRQALKLGPPLALFHLGLASILEAGAPAAPELGLPPGAAAPPPQADPARSARLGSWVAQLGDEKMAVRDEAQASLRPLVAAHWKELAGQLQHRDLEVRSRIRQLLSVPWLEEALAEYWKAYQLALAPELKSPYQPSAEALCFEAAEAWQRLLKLRAPSAEEQDRAAQVGKDLQALRAKPQALVPITPLIFSLRQQRELGDLLAPGKRVRFDLDGDGRAEARPWVRPETCILVWDPEGTGRIRSGRQLFGSVTWWLFWRDAYQALEALDDNRDGLLSGSELQGLAVWRDANGNARSEPGEVVPLEALEIEALAVRPSSRQEASPLAEKGLRLRSGEWLPTWDWVIEPDRQALSQP